MTSYNVKLIFAWTICLLVLSFVVHVYVTNSIKNTYTQFDMQPNNKDGFTSHLSTRNTNYETNVSAFSAQGGNIGKLLISPAKIPRALERRLDRSTKVKFISRLEILRRGQSSNKTTDRPGNLVNAFDILHSMGYFSRLPDVINIGIKKSGTTALMFYLKNHPQIQTSLEAREVHYFDWHYKNGLRWYESQMKIARNDQVVYEKTPRYYVHEHAAKRIYNDLRNDLRFILCVRDPVSRLISDFHFTKQIRASKDWMEQQTAETEAKRFEEAVLQKNGRIKSSNEMVLTSNYAFHFKRWLKYYHRNQFLIIDNSEMVDNVLETLQQVEAFLGLTPYYKKDMIFRTKTDQICLRINSKTSCPKKISSSVLPKPKISFELEQKLRDYYRPLNEEFEILAGRTFDWAAL